MSTKYIAARKPSTHASAACLLLCHCLSSASYTFAEENPEACAPSSREELLVQVACMSDAELQTLRGGFIRDNQIVIGFGFERIVRIDGEVQEHILAGLPSLNLTNNIQLVPVSRSLDTGSSYILTNAMQGNVASSRELSITGAAPQMQLLPSTSALQDMMNNVIQNSLDDKIIDQVRVVNIDLMGLGTTPRFDPQNDLNPALFERLGL
jgi:hypothetical protein